MLGGRKRDKMRVRACVTLMLLTGFASADLLDMLGLGGLLSLAEHELHVFVRLASQPEMKCDMTADTDKNLSAMNIYWYPTVKEEGRKYAIDAAAKSVADEKIDWSKPFKLIISGFNTPHDPFAAAFLQGYSGCISDNNIFFVDHYYYTRSSYSEEASYKNAINYLYSIAERVSRMFLVELIDRGLIDCDRIHVIGHSFGSHITGVIGKLMQKKLGGKKISRCTGLDPCAPCIDAAPQEFMIRSGDCAFVDCMHTNQGQMGTSHSVCDVDSFPNGDPTQPGCEAKGLLGSLRAPDVTCSHLRAIGLWLESVQNPNAFYGRACHDWEYFSGGKCEDRPVVLVGEATPKDCDPESFYFYRTGADNPYGMGHDGAKPGKTDQKTSGLLGFFGM